MNIDFERRSKAAYTGWAMVTSIAHIWFNAYFEGGDQHTSNVFEADWEALDGIKGTTKKGVRALDRLKVVWRYPSLSELGLQKDKQGTDIIAPVSLGQTVTEPKPGEPVPEAKPADWRGQHHDPSEDSERPLREQERDKENEKENLVPRERIAEATDHQHEPGSKGLTYQTEHPWLSEASTAAASAASATAHSFHGLEKELGLRKQTDESHDVSLANSEDELNGRSTPAKAGKYVSAAPGAAPDVSAEGNLDANRSGI